VDHQKIEEDCLGNLRVLIDFIELAGESLEVLTALDHLEEDFDELLAQDPFSFAIFLLQYFDILLKVEVVVDGEEVFNCLLEPLNSWEFVLDFTASHAN